MRGRSQDNGCRPPGGPDRDRRADIDAGIDFVLEHDAELLKWLEDA